MGTMEHVWLIWELAGAKWAYNNQYYAGTGNNTFYGRVGMGYWKFGDGDGYGNGFGDGFGLGNTRSNYG